MQKKFQFVTFLTISWLMLAAPNAHPADQTVYLLSDAAAPSGKVYVTVQYNCPDTTTTALGVRIHFNSSKLNYDDYDNFLSTGSLATPQLQEDMDNTDEHADTDKFILIGYQDADGNWPNQTLPVNLIRLKFTPTGTGDTTLNVSRVTNAAGFGFSATPLTLGPPTLSTTAPNAISQSTASAGGTITSDGGAAITARGVCWSTSQNPTISNNKTTDGSGTGAFTSSITGLSANTTYYVRAFATNSLGTGYGNQGSFTTSQTTTIPTVATHSANTITPTSAGSGGNVSFDGGATVTARGVCWSTSQTPTLSDNKTTDGSGTGAFSSAMTNLLPSTTYYVRAYAINSKGTGYGQQISFATPVSYTISGYVKNSSNGYAISGATLSFSNNGGTVTTNSSGYYTQTFSSGWSGAVTPFLEGYTFDPRSRSCSAVSSSLFNQDFAAKPITYMISGLVEDQNGNRLSGATVRFSNDAAAITTDRYGYYSKQVAYKWSGTVAIQKDGYAFSPESRPYSSVTTRLMSQNFTGTPTNEPAIRVSPESLVFNQSKKRRSQSGPPTVLMDTRENDDYQPIDGKYPTGLVIPDHVDEYWKTHAPTRRYRARANLPSSMDWSVYDSPVKSQGACGSCWAFAAMALIENLANRANLSVDVNFAEQVFVSCLFNGDGCGGGYCWAAFDYMKKHGVPHESCHPYTASNGSCSKQCANPDFLVKISSFSTTLWGKTDFNVDDLKGALQDGPITVAMSTPYSFFSYRGGIYQYDGGDHTFGHGVLLVGYDDDERAFKAKNSWGTGWGENGYFRISYDDVTSDVRFGCYASTASGIYLEGDGGETRQVTVSNTGTGDLTVTSISTDKSWLTVFPDSFFTILPNNEATFSVSISDWNAISPLQNTAVITLSSNDPDEPDIQIQATAMMSSLQAETPPLSVSPPFYAETSTDNNTFTIHVGNDAGETFIDILNTGDGDMTWTATTSDSWLTISEGNAGTNSGRTVIQYDVNTSDPRTGTVTISADNAAKSLQTVHIYQALLDEDADDDGMPDTFELIYGFDASNPDDAFGDQDNDGLTNVKEYQIRTNPVQQDTDGDCVSDGDEIQQGTDPLVQDAQTVTLRHVVNILEILTSITPESICPGADADGNGTVEIKDAILALRSVAGMR